MKKKEILQRLKNDEDYYGDFGNQFLSNSHVGRLLNDPLNIFKPMKPSPAFLIGGYFHTCILEPDKLKKAEEYVLAGGDIKAIESKYKLTEKQEKQLHGNFKTENTKKVK